MSNEVWDKEGIDSFFFEDSNEEPELVETPKEIVIEVASSDITIEENNLSEVFDKIEKVDEKLSEITAHVTKKEIDETFFDDPLVDDSLKTNTTDGIKLKINELAEAARIRSVNSIKRKSDGLKTKKTSLTMSEYEENLYRTLSSRHGGKRKVKLSIKILVDIGLKHLSMKGTEGKFETVVMLKNTARSYKGARSHSVRLTKSVKTGIASINAELNEFDISLKSRHLFLYGLKLFEKTELKDIPALIEAGNEL